MIEERDQSELDEKVDCWSLGVIISYALGCFPFKLKEGEFHYYRAIRDCDVCFESEAWKEKSEELKDLISRLLVKDPSRRLSAKEILEHDWIKKFSP